MNETGSGHSPYIDTYINNFTIMTYYNDIQTCDKLPTCFSLSWYTCGGYSTKKNTLVSNYIIDVQ
jgi:hypothetical protein